MFVCTKTIIIIYQHNSFYLCYCAIRIGNNYLEEYAYLVLFSPCYKMWIVLDGIGSTWFVSL